jgi:lactoylglutathione lyase
MFDKLGVVMVVVSDMTRSVAFYRDVLGLPLRYQTPYWSEFDVGGVVLALHPAGDTLAVEPTTGINFGFYVEEIDAVLEQIRSRGGEIASRDEEPFGILAHVRDPDGYRIQVCQPKR